MSNAQTLDDLRYCADHFAPSEQAESNLRIFAAALIGAGISPPAQKPASELGGSGAGLVGTPVITPFHVVGPFAPIKKALYDSFNSCLPVEWPYDLDRSVSLDAPDYLPHGGARALGRGRNFFYTGFMAYRERS